MFDLRPRQGLGGGDQGWLDTRHHFSFADYHDPARMHWGAVRVWNDDRIAPGSGFPPHPHRDMEIITYVREGAITHADSLGNSGRTAAGDVQVMSAGTGIIHSEYNREAVPTRLFQIWILPEARGLEPRWGSRRFPASEREGRFSVLASGFGEEGALGIAARARVAGITLAAGARADYPLAAGRRAYLVPASGRFMIGGQTVGEGDGVAVAGESGVPITAIESGELVLVDTV
jgi:redox-sensitive bicupin YhaK (pirin superfamily)